MSKKAYPTDRELEITELANDLENVELSQVNEKSLEILAEMLSFLYTEDKKHADA
jgi:hypothetical protein